MPTIFHIAPLRDWLAAEASGAYRGSTRDRSLQDEGFIHCSDAHQVVWVANAFYGDVDEPLVVLSIATEDLDADVRYETADGDTESFPHLYGELPIRAVTTVTALQRDSAGHYAFAEGIRE